METKSNFNFIKQITYNRNDLDEYEEYENNIKIKKEAEEIIKINIRGLSLDFANNSAVMFKKNGIIGVGIIKRYLNYLLLLIYMKELQSAIFQTKTHFEL